MISIHVIPVIRNFREMCNSAGLLIKIQVFCRITSEMSKDQ